MNTAGKLSTSGLFSVGVVLNNVADDSDGIQPLPERDFTRYASYELELRVVVYDEEKPTAWIQAAKWDAEPVLSMR